MKNGSGNAGRVPRKDLRNAAEFYAGGPEWQKMNEETQRLIRLAMNEAEALAAQTGVPELVLPELAEEKVTALKQWAARQRLVRARQQEWSLAA